MKLADAIEKLRNELSEAQINSIDKKLRFKVDEVQLELSLVLTDATELGGAAKAWFVEASAKGSTATATAHKIVLKLIPEGGENRPAYVSSSIKETVPGQHG